MGKVKIELHDLQSSRSNKLNEQQQNVSDSESSEKSRDVYIPKFQQNIPPKIKTHDLGNTNNSQHIIIDLLRANNPSPRLNTMEHVLVRSLDPTEIIKKKSLNQESAEESIVSLIAISQNNDEQDPHINDTTQSKPNSLRCCNLM